ncbi:MULTISPECIES: hypothetical protein [unclassified Neptuniibacter]|jgi:hypothetical protein|uniref:hypothetical protein n=1 Tax=unclassified Neptuniibacter TaxID=2630693 RepID=UPI0026E292A6|nr:MULTISPECIES: hypothetical protein [unclassified Neptuniibacter]MDO6513102.1 hypothetical protein [Neptuniibacter sp. 2_MG-2023]MDO6592486.1 hypothetical protein [Neptuniibacter sp. 1_MG-2023]
MTEEELISRLSALSTEQLDAIQNSLLEKIRDKDAKRERLTKLPPRTSNDLEALADMQDLDLSSLLRDVKRYS